MGWVIFAVLLLAFIMSTIAALAMTPAEKDWRENPPDPFDGVKMSIWTVATGKAFKEVARNVEREERRPDAIGNAWAVALLSGVGALLTLILLLAI